jgi:hypothetical protein
MKNILGFNQFINESFLDNKAFGVMGSLFSGGGSEISPDQPQKNPTTIDPSVKSGSGCDNWSKTVTTSTKGYQTGVISSVWNGSGKPKITIDKADKNGFTLTYLGNPSGEVLIHGKCGGGDTVHQSCIVLEKELNKHFKWLEKDGILVKPDYDGIKLDGPVLEKGKSRLTITVPLLPATEKDSINRMKRRGGWGHPQWAGLKEMESESIDKKSKGCNGVHTYTYPSEYQSDRNKWKNAKLVEHFIFWKE